MDQKREQNNSAVTIEILNIFVLFVENLLQYSHRSKKTFWNFKAAGLLEYVWPFCYHQALKG